MLTLSAFLAALDSFVFLLPPSEVTCKVFWTHGFIRLDSEYDINIGNLSFHCYNGQLICSMIIERRKAQIIVPSCEQGFVGYFFHHD